MAGYAKELMIDLANGDLPIDDRVNLIYAATQLLNSGEITKFGLRMVILYSSGYTVAELCSATGYTELALVELMESTLEKIAEQAGYSDSHIVHMAYSRSGNKRRKELAPVIIKEHGRNFSTHEVTVWK
jgi:hypothetical protein